MVSTCVLYGGTVRGVEIRPAATVILLRDRDGLEVLTQRRSHAMAFAPGAYAFPGGALEPIDYQSPDAHKAAAVRELSEETGLLVAQETLHLWAHWITPPGRTRRFDTLFYVAAAPSNSEVTLVDAESEAHLWISPQGLLAKYDADEVTMLPPTYITLRELSEFNSTAEVLASTKNREITFFDGVQERS